MALLDLRLTAGEPYTKDINALRDRFRSNGTAYKFMGVRVWEPPDQNTPGLHRGNLSVIAWVNLAFNMGCVTTRGFSPSAAAYIVGFEGNSTRHFALEFRKADDSIAAIDKIPTYQNAPANPFVGVPAGNNPPPDPQMLLNDQGQPVDGRYATLGYNKLPNMTLENLRAAVPTVANWDAAAQNNSPQSVRQYMAVLVIAVCEAARFKVVEDGVQEVLRGNSFNFENIRGDTIDKWHQRCMG